MYIELKKKLPTDLVILKARVGKMDLPPNQPIQLAAGVMAELKRLKLADPVSEEKAKAFVAPKSGKPAPVVKKDG